MLLKRAYLLSVSCIATTLLMGQPHAMHRLEEDLAATGAPLQHHPHPEASHAAAHAPSVSQDVEMVDLTDQTEALVAAAQPAAWGSPPAPLVAPLPPMVEIPSAPSPSPTSRPPAHLGVVEASGSGIERLEETRVEGSWIGKFAEAITRAEMDDIQALETLKDLETAWAEATALFNKFTDLETPQAEDGAEGVRPTDPHIHQAIRAYAVALAERVDDIHRWDILRYVDLFLGLDHLKLNRGFGVLPRDIQRRPELRDYLRLGHTAAAVREGLCHVDLAAAFNSESRSDRALQLSMALTGIHLFLSPSQVQEIHEITQAALQDTEVRCNPIPEDAFQRAEAESPFSRLSKTILDTTSSHYVLRLVQTFDLRDTNKESYYALAREWVLALLEEEENESNLASLKSGVDQLLNVDPARPPQRMGTGLRQYLQYVNPADAIRHGLTLLDMKKMPTHPDLAQYNDTAGALLFMLEAQLRKLPVLGMLRFEEKTRASLLRVREQLLKPAASSAAAPSAAASSARAAQQNPAKGKSKGKKSARRKK